MDYGTLSNAALAAAMRLQQQQHGGSLLPHFRSTVSYQRGRGLGGLIRGLFRRVTPLLKKPIVRKGLKTLGKAAATAVLEAGQEALRGEQSFGSALKTSSQKQAQGLIRKARQNMTGGRHKRTPKRKKNTSRQQLVVKKRRVRSRDIFEDI
jgi:hypothetical protein